MLHAQQLFIKAGHRACFVGLVFLMLGLVACGGGGGTSDTTPPQVVTVSPTAGANDIQVAGAINATFSEAIDCTTLTTSSFTLSTGLPVSGDVTCNGTTVSFSPTAQLNNSTTYTANLSTGIKDLAGNALATAYSWSFTTVAQPGADTTPPSVFTTQPADQSTGALLDGTITVTFSEAVDCDYLSFSVFDGQAYLGGQLTCNGNTMHFTPGQNFSGNTPYELTIDGKLRDLAGNPMGQDYVWHFTTAAQLGIISTQPADLATGVALDAPVTATFSTPVNCATVDFSLAVSDGPIPGSVTCSGAVATFTPSVALQYSTSITASIEATATDQNGTPLLGKRYEWKFETAAPPDLTPPAVNSTTPLDGAGKVSIDASLTATFSEAMDCATLTDSTFVVNYSGGSVTGAVSCSGDSASFVPAAPLAMETPYTAMITTGAKDLAGNALSAAHAWSFTTAGASSKVVFVNTGFDMFIINDDGTNGLPLANSADRETFAGYSPTGRVIYARVPVSGVGATGIYSVKLDGTDTIPLVVSNIPKSVMGVTSSGRVIYQLVVNGQSDLYSIKDDGTGQVTLADSPDYYETYDLTPPNPYSGITALGITPSEKVVYNRVSVATNESDVYIINADGTQGIPLGNTAGDERWATILPGGRVGYYVKPVSGSAYTVIVAEDGSNPITLDTSLGSIVGYESGQIIMSGYPPGGLAALYSVDPTNGLSTELVKSSYNTRPVLFGVGNGQVLFTPYLSGNLYSVPAAGGGVVTLADSTDVEAFEHVGTNGFVSFRRLAGNDVDIYGINADGTGLSTLAADPNHIEQSRAVLPDGRVVFERKRVGDCADLYIVNADGSGEIPLDDSTDCKTFSTVTKTGRILYLRNNSGTMQLYSVKPDGSDRVVLHGGNTYSVATF